jgi:phosphoglycerol transferase MdoB-like AlkP superfamily enzyme
VLVVLLTIAVIPLDVLARQNVLVNAAQLVLCVPMAAVGFIVARRQPGNPIGWLLLGIPVGVLLSLAAGPYAWLVYRMGYRLPFGPAAVLAENASWVALTIALPPVLVLFPDGELSSRRWRWVLWSYLTIATGLFLLGYAAIATIIVTQGVHLDAGGGLAGFDHPSGSTAWVSKVIALFPVLLVFWLVFAARLVLSCRGASGDRRQQLKWLLAGSIVAVAGFVISNVVPALDPGAVAVGVGVVLPVCLGVAILK